MTWNDLAALLHLPVTDRRVIDLIARGGRRVAFAPGSIELPQHGVFLEIFRDTINYVLFSLERESSSGRWRGALPLGISARLTYSAALRLDGVTERHDDAVILRRDGLIATLAFRGEKLRGVYLQKPRSISAVRAAPKAVLTWQELAAVVGRSRTDPAFIALVLRTVRQLGWHRDLVGLWGHGAVLILAKDVVREARLHLERVPGFPGVWKGGLPAGIPRKRPAGSPEIVRIDNVVTSYGPRALRAVSFLRRASDRPVATLPRPR